MLIFVEVFYVSKITTRQNSHFSRRHPALPSHAFPRFPRFPRPSGRHGGGVGHGNDGGGGGGVRHGHVAGLHGGGVRHGHIASRGNAESGQLSLEVERTPTIHIGVVVYPINPPKDLVS